METVSNPFSGQSIAMPKFAVAVYDVTMGSNHIAERYDQVHGMGASPAWKDVRKGLDWFRKYFAKEYMVLLDCCPLAQCLKSFMTGWTSARCNGSAVKSLRTM